MTTHDPCFALTRARIAHETESLAPSTQLDSNDFVGFADIALGDRVKKCLRDYDIPAHLITLDVTETEIMADLGAATKVLYALSELAVKLGIDYGTGCSSLQYLHMLPVNELKIDRSFVTNLPSEDSNRIIVQSSIQMAHNLGLYVIAEGAEDEMTCAMLAELECDYIQGY
jgi:EAL domain-containing protein (putative c-di-GMP-specific phosphodiesterase class I)